ncbi:MAG: ASKHA domain-containing protein [Chloroflexota bacterium]
MDKSGDKKRVRFEPDNIEVMAEVGANLLQVAIDAGVLITASCGGAGVCGTCKVLIKQGEVETSQVNGLSEEEVKQGYRRACRSRVKSDLIVHIPVESRLDRSALGRDDELPVVVLSGGVSPMVTGTTVSELPVREELYAELATELPRTRPPVSKFFLKLPPPTLEDNISDLSRVLRGLKQDYKLINLTADFEVVKKLPGMLREKDWEVTVTTLVTAVAPTRGARHRPRLINIEPGDTRDRYYSLGFDIGTTTVCGQLLDLNQRRTLAQSTDYNRQISYGQDVITRIAYCQKPGGLERLQQAVVQSINSIIKELLAESRVKLEDVGHFIVAGNTTMIHILFGIDPRYIRLTPYVPAANLVPPVKATSLGIEVGEHVYVHSLPLVASYIGADIVSGILAAGMHRKDELTLYIDIGTNGQIVLGSSEWMVTAACSAGPAFEGGGITHGMVATNGAIEDLVIDPKTLGPHLSTIGGEKPKGICGSGLISIIASMLTTGIIGQNGKFNTESKSKRIREGADGFEYVLAWAKDTQTGKDIVITEVDIENLIRAKAALYAGLKTLAGSVGVSLRDLKQVTIAGAFGSYIDVEKAITIGLLPDIPRERFSFIGNGSLLGVRLTSFYTDMIDDARKVASMMTNFELSENLDFMSNYIAALFLPHTSLEEFPSVSGKLNRRRVRV